MGIVSGVIVFLDNSILDLMELVNGGGGDYRFQYMNKNKELIRRWDNAPHYRSMKSFPYHLHTKNGVEDSKKMNLIEVLDIVLEKVIQGLNL